MPRLSKIGAAALAAFGWTGLQSVTADFLVVAGGGGSGNGGGGAGGYRTSAGASGGGGSAETKLTLNTAQSYTVTVGAGGAAGPSGGGSPAGVGGNSIFSTITSTGGGSGGNSGNASAGGSGGGGRNQSAGGAGTANQGFAGGFGGAAFPNDAGGGAGGAGSVGQNANPSSANGTGGNGGTGVSSSITGTSTFYASGGGASGRNAQGTASAGGGGNAGASVGVAGTANTGGGGGGGAGQGTAGGSGVVIISYTSATQLFGGGTVTQSGGNFIHTFTSSGALSPLSSVTASYLVVAGGGGGGLNLGAGAGAGGLLTGSGLTLDANSIYTVTVGAGGASNTSGSNSLFSGFVTTAVGGGAGAPIDVVGTSGGSGGGGGGQSSRAGGSGTSGQGNAGGSGGAGTGTNYASGGGGGAGAVGGNANNTGVSGAGGAGSASSISGSSVTYAGGGGGAVNAGYGNGAGGSGGGGAGGTAATSGTAGTANTGGGGGGGGNTSTNPSAVGGSGGSGVVIISYAGATQLMAGGTVTISGGNVIHTFTSTGFLAPIDFVNNSLRFRSSASAYLNRTFGTGNRKTYTLSFWVKRGALGRMVIFVPGDNATYGGLSIEANNTIEINNRVGGTNAFLITSQVFRDPSAWYHLVWNVDTTQATASNRSKLYVNGAQVTSFSTANYPAQNADTNINNAIVHWIGRFWESGFEFPFDGYMTEVNFIDGQALTPTSFGTINSYGVWQPITYGGSYGTNGFYLPFTNTTSTTTLGYDFSPQGNNWTTNNISLTAGATYDSMTDVPTLTSATAANYAVLNPLSTLFTVTSGNLNFTYTNSTSGVWYLKGTLAVSSDKYYWEVTPTNVGAGQNISIGIILSTNTQTNTTTINLVTDGYVYHCDGNKYSGSSGPVAYGATYTNNDVIGVALDLTAGTLVFYKNNVSQGTAYTGLTSSYMQLICNHLGGTSRTVAGSVNAGQRPFTYTPPSGFVALNTFNL